MAKRSMEEQNRVNDEFAQRLIEFNQREDEIQQLQQQMQSDGEQALKTLRAHIARSMKSS